MHLLPHGRHDWWPRRRTARPGSNASIRPARWAQRAWSWLSAPPTQTMQSVFRNHARQPEEILPLLALVDDANKRSQPADKSSMAKFVLSGISGMLVGLAVLQLAWRGRFGPSGEQ